MCCNQVKAQELSAREGEHNFNLRLLFSAVPLEVIIMAKLLVNYITGLLYRSFYCYIDQG